ncbi:MAG TPA: TetR/AcrR family transcriptional regulator [Polyangiaceae bacterium]|nr:TetR/AcrR family transcriptional regulator [Polyangiaceae bacterium]
MPRPRSDIAPRILHAARARFLSDGVDGASLRGIASDAGTSIGMVYYYFATKDELFFAVVEELYEKLLKDIEAAIAPDVPVPDRIERLYLRVARLSEEELLVMRLIAREALTSSTRFARLRQRFQTGHIPLIARLIVDGFTGGAFDPKLHPMVAMLSVAGMGILPQLIRRVLDGILPFPGAPAGPELSKQLVRVLFAGTGPATGLAK